MVNSESLLDIFKSENSERSDKYSSRNYVNNIYLDSSPKSETIVSDLSIDSNKMNKEVAKSENCEGDLSWCLQLSEESNNNEHQSHSKSFLPDSASSEETYISIDTPSISLEDSKDSVLSCEPGDHSGLQVSQDMFEESQENEIINPSRIKIEHVDSFERVGVIKEEGTPGIRQPSAGSSSSDSNGSSNIPEVKDSSSSQEIFQILPGSSASSNPADSPLECRERQEEWTSQELSAVSQRLELSRKQAKRLILTVIRKRQMAEETLVAFKKRLKRF